MDKQIGISSLMDELVPDADEEGRIFGVDGSTDPVGRIGCHDQAVLL